MDSHPPLGNAPLADGFCEVLSTARMVGNAHRVLLARKTSLNSPVQLSCALVWAVLVNQLFLRLSILDIYCYRLDCRLDISYIH